MRWLRPHCVIVFSVLVTFSLDAQEYGEADRGSPADAMIQRFLTAEAERLHAKFLDGVDSARAWEERRPRYRREYLHMLGLWPLPERTPLRATVTGEVRGDGFLVEKLHFQSRPRLYVSANLYRPAGAGAGKRRPAVLYVCGHSFRPRNGNKTAYQSHGIWFARHGYVCLLLDTLQLGEIAAIHHGTYREERWWWLSRGYTPAGVECWNGVRAIDYLTERADVDPERIAVTGISGGGAASFWIAAADERVRVAVPVSGMADLPSYVGNRVINGHCDCMFLHNTFAWPWTRIAALIAPRPLLFANSDADPIFPMDANRRISNRLERLYSLFGASGDFDTMVSVGGHAYREDLRRTIYRFINIHLKGDGRPVGDSEVDLVEGRGNDAKHPIPPVELRVFPTDGDIPADELNTSIDRHFVPVAEVALPKPGGFAAWKTSLLAKLTSETSLRRLAELPPAARRLGAERRDDGTTLHRLETEHGIIVHARSFDDGAPGEPILLQVTSSELDAEAWPEVGVEGKARRVLFEPRGGASHPWTRRNPPNYVERSHALLGTTVDTERLRDIVSFLRALGREQRDRTPIHIAARGADGVLAAYAALFDGGVASVTLIAPPLSHDRSDAPQFLSILRVADVPELLGALAPRPLVLTGLSARDAAAARAVGRIRAIYEAAGGGEQLRVEGIGDESPRPR